MPKVIIKSISGMSEGTPRSIQLAVVNIVKLFFEDHGYEVGFLE